jgi:hypothetical protein
MHNVQNLNAWWSRIRASIIVVLANPRQNARHDIHKHKVPAVARPPVHITKECVLHRFRAGVTEEAVVKEGILFAGVIGHVQEEQSVLSATLGGATVCRQTSTQLRASVAPLRGSAPD